MQSLPSPHATSAAVPVCTLPCSARFALWCLRVAALSARGCELARDRLNEVHEVLGQPGALPPLQQCVELVLSAQS